MISPCNLYSTCETFLVSHYSIVNYYIRCSNELHSLVAPVQTFPVRTRNAVFTVANRFYSLRVYLVRNKFNSGSFFFPNNLPCGSDSWEEVSKTTTFLISPCLVSTIIYFTSLHMGESTEFQSSSLDLVPWERCESTSPPKYE